MTTCVINPLMMGAIPRQRYQEHGAKSMNENDLMDEMKKQVQDSSYWSPSPAQARDPTERPSRSALRALLQQPPPLSLVPDSRSESHAFPNGAIQPSWSPYHPDQADFKTPNSLSDSKSFPQQYDTPPSSDDHQVGHQGFDMQSPTSHDPYHANYSYRSGLPHIQPAVPSIPFKQEQSNELELLHQRQALQHERTSRPDFQVGSPSAGSSLPKEFEKMQLMNFAHKQMREQMKNRLERWRSFDKKNQTSPPRREGAGGSKLKFGITADGIPNGPDNHPMLHSQQQQQPRLQEQQQTLFSRGFLPTVNQLHDQDMHTVHRVSPAGSSFSMETKIDVEDTEAFVIKQFQEKVFQLDMGTRLGFQESLYRLARSARERQDSTRTSAEPDFAAMMDLDLDSCDRPTSGPQSRAEIETQTKPTDRTLVNMLFFPLRLPGVQSPTDHSPSWSRSRAVAAASSQGNWNWSTQAAAASEHPNRKGPANMLQAQFRGRDGSGAALEETTSGTRVTPHSQTWSGAPHLAEYASPPPGSSPVDPSMLKNRPADFNLTYRGAAAPTPRQIHSSTTEPVDIRAPRRCDSQSSIASDLSNSPSHGGQVSSFKNIGFHGSSSYGSQEAGSFSESQHVELAAAANHSMDQHLSSNHNFAMMNMNDDILGAALSIQNRAEVNQIDRFHRPQLSTSPNSNARNVTVGFSPMQLYEDGSRFEAESRGRSLGALNSPSTGMSIFDQRTATVLRNTADTVAYTRPTEFFQA